MTEVLEEGTASEDILSPNDAAHVPLQPDIDDIVADNLKPDDVVVVDDRILKFIMKLPGRGPHIFIDSDTGEPVRLTTRFIWKLMDEGSYYRPNATVPPARGQTLDPEQYKKISFGAVRARPRRRAESKWLYVSEFLSRKLLADGQGKKYGRSHPNAQSVIDKVDADIVKLNDQLKPHQWYRRPLKLSTRSVLRWVAKEIRDSLGVMGCVHENALAVGERRLPDECFVLIAETIREHLKVSPKVKPENVHIFLGSKIAAANLGRAEPLPLPSLGTVKEELRRYDAWVRLKAERGAAAAELEYGVIGKLVRPKRILDEAECDHHQIDFHGFLGETVFGQKMIRAGIDRFWITLIIDLHSEYPLGFSIGFEPGGLLPALAALDHALNTKEYVKERWPGIDGDLLSYGKMVKLRYDNAKEFVTLQMQAKLQLLGIGFEHARSKRGDSKPYIERFFGTLESDFVSWLKGYTGSNPKLLGDRDPRAEACVTLDDFIRLFHQWLIEVYARRPHAGINDELPVDRWMAGCRNPSHRPRPLTKEEREKVDYICSIEKELNVRREGAKYDHVFYQSEELQKIRRFSGRQSSIKLWARIPLRDISRAHFAVPTRLVDIVGAKEITTPSTNPDHVKQQWWQHRVTCEEVLANKNDPEKVEKYRQGKLRLLGEAMKAMGISPDGGEPTKPRYTNGQAPRYGGVFQYGVARPALDALYDKVVMHADHFTALLNQQDVPAEPKTDAVKAAPAPAPPTTAWDADPINMRSLRRSRSTPDDPLAEGHL